MDENNQKKKYAGAKRIFKHQKLSPVLTGVLYYGRRKWKTPLRLHEMIRFPEEMEEDLKPYIADYPINVVQVAHLTKEERERLTSDFRIVAEYLACQDDEEKWSEFLENTDEEKWSEFLENTKEIRHAEELLDVIWELSGDELYQTLKKKVQEQGKRKKGWTMCEMIRSVERRGIETGIETGIQTGLRTGIFAMIRENLDMGREKHGIVEKLVKYFSITEEKALHYYEQAVIG